MSGSLGRISDEKSFEIQKKITFEERKIDSTLKQRGGIEKSKVLDGGGGVFIALPCYSDYTSIEYKVHGFVW